MTTVACYLKKHFRGEILGCGDESFTLQAKSPGVSEFIFSIVLWTIGLIKYFYGGGERKGKKDFDFKLLSKLVTVILKSTS